MSGSHRQCVAAGQHNEHIGGSLTKNTIGYKVFDESFGERTSQRQAIFTRAKRSLHRIAERGTLVRVG